MDNINYYHHGTLLHICKYFKSINFNMDIVPQLLKTIDDVYVECIVQDAIQHEWYVDTPLFKGMIALYPPPHFKCSHFTSSWIVKGQYLLQTAMFDANARKTGSYKTYW